MVATIIYIVLEYVSGKDKDSAPSPPPKRLPALADIIVETGPTKTEAFGGL